VLESFFILVTPWAGIQFILLEPGVVGGQVTFSAKAMVDFSCNEFSQAHEGVWGEAGRVGVVGVCWVLSGPFFEENGFGFSSEGDKFAFHEWGGRDVSTSGGRGVVY